MKYTMKEPIVNILIRNYQLFTVSEARSDADCPIK